MADLYDNCPACGAKSFGSAETKEGRAMSYDCLAELFVWKSGKVRTIKLCLYNGGTRLAP